MVLRTVWQRELMVRWSAREIFVRKDRFQLGHFPGPRRKTFEQKQRLARRRSATEL